MDFHVVFSDPVKLSPAKFQVSVITITVLYQFNWKYLPLVHLFRSTVASFCLLVARALIYLLCF